MNSVPITPLARPRSSGGSIGNASSTSRINSPTSARSKGRKRDSDAAGLESSASGDDGVEGTGGRRRQPGVKRACNECRQQKLKCDVITEPTYRPCERCRRLKLECRIDSNFKRVGKRSKNAEMEREITELRRQLASQQTSPTGQGPLIKTPSDGHSPNVSRIPSHLDQYIGSEEATIASLMDLRSGQEGGSFMKSPNAQLLLSRRIGDVVLTQDRVQELFMIFFTFYHPFVPLLDPGKSPDEYYEASRLLFWVIISVAARHHSPNPSLLGSLSDPLSKLLWTCVSEVPQSYIVVKALCLLCTWPLPINSTTADPTFMLCGITMQIAMQIGLHRPSHAQDFTKFRVELREEELRDRVRTWAACNAIAQRVATGYGQPPSTFYDWTLAPSGIIEAGFVLPTDVENRLMIERFSNKVTSALYSNRSDPLGLAGDSERSVLTTFLTREYEDLEQKLQASDSFAMLYLRASGLHLHLSAFFDSPTSKDYNVDLLALWRATTSFLESAFDLRTDAGEMFIYSTNYILQMIIAAGFTLLKLLNSFFATYVNLEYGRDLFNRTIWAIRSISVGTNDLPSRLAEVLVQLWKSSGAGSKKSQPTSDAMENSLQLKVKCRMSMSLVFDSVWRWREEFQAKGRGNLESALKNPTNPDSAVESSATSVADNSLAPSNANALGAIDRITPDGFGDAYNEVFDPLNWMFDGFVEFPNSLSSLPDLDGGGLV